MTELTESEQRRLALARPADRSLEAYKTWIQKMVRAMGGPTGTTTEEEWRELHAEFWAGVPEETTDK